MACVEDSSSHGAVPDPGDMVKRKKLMTCEVCAINEAKYTCPKCQVRTCCISCVNIHKKELECDGIRDRTKFLPLQSFTNTDFYSDYAFLEECSRFVYGKKRNVAMRYTNIDKPLPHYLNRLKRATRDRGTVVMFLPEHFVRRKQNSTRLAKLGHIMWRVDFIFGDKIYPHKGMPIPETTRLGKILHDKLEDTDPSLDCYRAAGVANLRMLLKAERVRKCANKFYELDPDVTLKENLVGKCIVEYPTIYVFPRDHTYGLDIVNSDDELEDSAENGHENVAENQRNAAGNNAPIADGEKMDISVEDHNDVKPVLVPSIENDDKVSRKRSYNRELATTRVVREEREKLQKEVEEQVRKKPKNLLFVTGYSSDEDVDSDN